MNFWIILVLCTSCLTMSVESQEEIAMDAPAIPTVAQNIGLSTLVTLLTDADLASLLEEPDQFTVFGPTNEALAALPQISKDNLKEKENLALLLLYHVLPAKVLSSDLKDELLVKTLTGQLIRVNLYPKNQSDFSVATVQCAPIDLSRVDQTARNGVVHVINKVMNPPFACLARYLEISPSFQKLTLALKTVSLLDAFRGFIPFTLFAPTDEAFNKLPEGALENLLKNETALAEVLALHVVLGTYCSAGLGAGPLNTLSIMKLDIVVSEGGVTANGANVITPDISVTNGVIHAIDTVLLPSNM